MLLKIIGISLASNVLCTPREPHVSVTSCDSGTACITHITVMLWNRFFFFFHLFVCAGKVPLYFHNIDVCRSRSFFSFSYDHSRAIPGQCLMLSQLFFIAHSPSERSVALLYRLSEKCILRFSHSW